MRNIEKIFVHCTGSQCGTSVQSILGVFKAMGWKNPGYHYLVDAEGTVHRLLGLDKVANGVRGHNATSVHVAYIGGLTASGKAADTRTAAQRDALRRLLADLRRRYPHAAIMGHRDISPDLDGNGKIESNEYIKACPCFNARDEYADI